MYFPRFVKSLAFTQNVYKFRHQRETPGAFKSYLSDWFQYDNIRNTMSDNLKVTCGVPQGSCLGPLSFLLYIKAAQPVAHEVFWCGPPRDF